MARMKDILLSLLVFLMIQCIAAAAISIDGVRSTGEWSEDWNFGQAEGTGYDTNGPFGDKMVIFQNGNWYDEDPINDSGTGFNETMATEGPNPSGYDLMGIYAHYDPAADVLYGMSTVYGLPGDLDGNGNISTLAENGDTAGPATGNSVTGIGIGEQFSILLLQGSKSVLVVVSSNDWEVTDLDSNPLPGITVQAANSQSAGAVYEISIAGLTNYFNLAPEEEFQIRVIAGGNLDIPGEDQARIFFAIPNPDIDIEKATNGEDADTSPGPSIVEGENVTWTYVVNNTGNVALSNVTVTDDILGLIGTIDTLAIGETATFEVIGTAECGQYANIANVTGEFSIFVVTDEDPSHYYGECPEIDIEKATNGEDADAAPGPGIMEDENITWTYVVNNTGNVDLTNVTVTDDVLGLIGTIDFLAAGESATLETTGMAECGQYANVGTATGEYGDATVNDSDPSHYYGECPEIDIEKATNGEDADAAPGPSIPQGENVTWTYVVTNTGNVELNNVTVTDDMLGPIGTIETLAPGESATLTAIGTAECGQYENLGTAIGEYGDMTVTDSDPSHYLTECESPGTGTPGYWKNHPEAWPVDEITIGDVVYTKEEAIEGMEHPVKKDKTYSMFQALVAAKLNVLIGNDDSCIADTITAADEWMAMYPLGSEVAASSDAWKIGGPLAAELDDYNNGLLCAPYRD